MTPVMQIQSQLKANKLEIQSREALIARLEAKVNQYQARLNATPGRQQELSDIMRNYDESKKNYDDLLGKTMASSLATSLNRQQQGDQFRIIDPPSLPEKVVVPGPLQVLAGWAGRRPGAGVRVRSRNRNSWTIASAAKQDLIDAARCRCWRKFRHCQPSGRSQPSGGNPGSRSPLPSWSRSLSPRGSGTPTSGDSACINNSSG